MKITIFGAGPVGLVTALCLSEVGHQVICVDVDQTKIKQLKKGESSIYEPGLALLLQEQLISQNIEFTSETRPAIEHAEIIFIAVNTPSVINIGCDLTFLEEAIEKIASVAQSPKCIVIKSTVPPGTHLQLKNKYANIGLEFISNPEFIREGSAVNDVRHPDRIVLGGENATAIEKIKNLFTPFVKTSEQFIVMDPTSAELCKYAANIMLASRISLMNEFSRLSEITGGDIENVRRGIGSDPRIGPDFLRAGLGYGGSCFPKDIEALVAIGKKHGETLALTAAVGETNLTQIKNFTGKILKYVKENKLQTLSIWGVTFKPLSNDLREAPALKVISQLIEHGLNLKIYDPVAGPELSELFKNQAQVSIIQHAYDCLKNSDALIIMTEWNEFGQPDFERIKINLLKPIIFDGRNIFDPKQMRALNFTYFSVGRNL